MSYANQMGTQIQIRLQKDFGLIVVSEIIPTAKQRHYYYYY